MANTLTALKPDYSRRRIKRRNKVTLTGNYATGGEILDLSSVLNPTFQPQSNFGTVPAIEDMQVINVPSGYQAQIVAGSGSTLGTAFNLMFFTTAGAQLAAAAYPAALTAAANTIEIIADQSTWS